MLDLTVLNSHFESRLNQLKRGKLLQRVDDAFKDEGFLVRCSSVKHFRQITSAFALESLFDVEKRLIIRKSFYVGKVIEYYYIAAHLGPATLLVLDIVVVSSEVPPPDFTVSVALTLATGCVEYASSSSPAATAAVEACL